MQGPRAARTAELVEAGLIVRPWDLEEARRVLAENGFADEAGLERLAERLVDGRLVLIQRRQPIALDYPTEAKIPLLSELAEALYRGDVVATEPGRGSSEAVNTRIEAKLITNDGVPTPDAPVIVCAPDGRSHELATGCDGRIRLAGVADVTPKVAPRSRPLEELKGGER